MLVHLTCSTCQRSFLRDRYDVRPGRSYCSVLCKRNRKPDPLQLTPDGTSALIPLRARDGTVRAHAIIDVEDIPLAEPWYWSMSVKGYAHRNPQINGRRQGIRLHCAILGLAPGDPREGDHIDRDKLNNRRSNLRIVPKKAQGQNQPSVAGSSSSYRGVSYRKDTGKWKASVTVEGKDLYLGCFETEVEAATFARAARRAWLPYATD